MSKNTDFSQLDSISYKIELGLDSGVKNGKQESNGTKTSFHALATRRDKLTHRFHARVPCAHTFVVTAGHQFGSGGPQVVADRLVAQVPGWMRTQVSSWRRTWVG